MSLAFRVLYAVHGKGTHHKLALDALSQLTGPNGQAWRRLFLMHAARYTEGSKAPDDVFKDFTNHVLHPRDNFWGGAADAAVDAYHKLVTTLRLQNWAEAAWFAGILSHYVVDPLMPFHTGQSEAENNIHRAAEWSINRAYDTLRAEGLKLALQPTLPEPAEAHWLQDLIRAGAHRSNADYERLLVHYDITRGVVDPPAGLDSIARKLAAELLLLAANTYARVLDRATAEAGVAPPEVSLLLPALLAAVRIPKAVWLKRLTDQADRAQVEAMYDELMATGKVEVHLPADDRIVRERHAIEVLGLGTQNHHVETVRFGFNSEVPIKAAVSSTQSHQIHTEPRAKLKMSDDLEAAPSIGPKLAESFARLNITTVADFLACNVNITAAALKRREVDAATLLQWQDQARLVLTIAGLTGTQARLLSGAGYRTAEVIATADGATLCAAVLRYAASDAGRRIIRDGAPPGADKIAEWVIQAGRAA